MTVPTGPPGEGGDDPGGLLTGLFGGISQWFEGLQALANPLQAFQEYARTFLQLLADRPVPTRNGDPAWFSRPDGAVMGAVYDVTWTQTLPIAILLAALYAGLATGMRGLVPPSFVPNRQATGAVWSSLGRALHVIFGWAIMVGWMVVVQGVATWLLPSGAVVLPGGQSLLVQVVAGGFGGYLLWLSSGILAVLVVLVWALSWMGALLAPPAYPLAIAASPPDIPVLRKFRMLPDEGLLVALVAVPVPTAFVLGVGYPIINAFRTATTGPIATLAGVSISSVLTLGMWFAALVAPLLMLAWARDLRPVAMFAAAALGAASATAVRDRFGGLPDSFPNPGLGGGTDHGAGVGGGGTTMDPLEGSPFQHSTDGGFGGALGGDGGDGTAAPLGAGTGAEQGAAGGTGMAAAPSTSASGATGPGPSGSSSIGETSRTVGSVDEIPDGQRYELGFETSDGEWQPVEDDTYSREFLFEGDDAFTRIDDAVNADTLYARGVQDAETYDIQNGRNDH